MGSTVLMVPCGPTEIVICKQYGFLSQMDSFSELETIDMNRTLQSLISLFKGVILDFAQKVVWHP